MLETAAPTAACKGSLLIPDNRAAPHGDPKLVSVDALRAVDAERRHTTPAARPLR
jgi:hypothetical protein